MNINRSSFVVTGGCNGLGMATVALLLDQGANVAALDINTKTDGISELITKHGNKLHVSKVDITNPSMVNSALDSAISKFGEIHGLVNCAGIISAGMINHPKSKYTMTKETFDRTLRINVTGTFIVSQTYVKKCVENKWKGGVIVNVASVAGEEGQQGQVAYSASKGAIMGMTLPLARELGRHNMRIVAVMPGLFQTNMSKSMPDKVEKKIIGNSALRRYGKPEEFAHFVKSIIENGYLTGVNLRLDGGTRLPML
jgi:NAD(P)-dependent dehydrogenase (short-subunit alcohol dehydrogenase family)